MWETATTKYSNYRKNPSAHPEGNGRIQVLRNVLLNAERETQKKPLSPTAIAQHPTPSQITSTGIQPIPKPHTKSPLPLLIIRPVQLIHLTFTNSTEPSVAFLTNQKALMNDITKRTTDLTTSFVAQS